MGIRIIAVHNGQQAIDYLEDPEQKDSFPCLVILDMNMPQLTGRETLGHLKSSDQLKNIPVVVVTTSSSPLDALYCQKMAVPMITKPTNSDAVRDVALKLLDMCKRAQSNRGDW